MAKKNVPYDEKYYDDVETWPREKLEELQLERLKDELVWSYENSPYYKRAWDEAGVDPHITSLKDLEKFPFIDIRPSATAKELAASSVSCAACPRTTSSTWRPARDRRAFPR